MYVTEFGQWTVQNGSEGRFVRPAARKEDRNLESY